ncbi:hypothetical protein K32_01490 [Kaistia sp. 32K]|uniref:hypothetical protein n=1 Tax=Kaistia sp. 32K TaxID=2795690 RepID=UPI001914F423|nr:hypothetical protein [Kaistia sp. 32K]BCP51532.1 hypothetical protein K32_01490 [Kaistia sp. 32K]
MKMQAKLLWGGAIVALGLFAAALPASAAPSAAQQACSDDWAKLKDAGKVPAGQTWPKFWSQCAKDYATEHPDAAAAPAAKSAAPAAKADTDTKPAKTAKPKADAAAAPAAEPAAKTAGKSPAMAACSDEWAKMKDAGKVPAGQTWPKFWSQCSKDYAAANPADDLAPAKAAKGKAAAGAVEADEGIALPDPESAAKINTAATTVGKRPLTPGQQAAIVRIRACGAEWQERKAAGKLPEGAKWPQYWSDCNKRLKAKGQ